MTDSTRFSMAGEELLTVEDVARILHLSRKTVYRLVRQRAIPFHRILRTVRFARADIEALVARGRAESVKPEHV